MVVTYSVVDPGICGILLITELLQSFFELISTSTLEITN
jgi:hypothetical protein